MKSKTKAPPLVKDMLQVVICVAVAAGLITMSYGVEQLVAIAISK